MSEPNHIGGRGKTHVSDEMLLHLYCSEKLTERQIAERVGLHYGTVHGRLRQANCPMRRRGKRSEYRND